MSGYRNAMLAKIHVAQKDMGLDDDTYRDLLERVTGKRSAKDLSDTQLVDVLAELKGLGWKAPEKPKRAGAASLAPGDAAAKARRIWLSLHHLCEVQDPAEAALHAFALGRTNLDSITWMTARHWSQVVEALKGWCERVGFEVPETESDGGLEAKRALVRLIWRKLVEADVIRIPNDHALDNWLYRITGNKCSLDHLTLDQLDRAADQLGRWLRTSRAKARS